MSRLLLALVLVGGLLSHRSVATAEERYQVRWKLQSGGVWPPAVMKGQLILKTGDNLAAHRLDTGRVIWTQRIPNLRYGEGVLDAGPRFVYVLGDEGLHLLDPATGDRVAATRGRPDERPLSRGLGLPQRARRRDPFRSRRQAPAAESQRVHR